MKTISCLLGVSLSFSSRLRRECYPDWNGRTKPCDRSTHLVAFKDRSQAHLTRTKEKRKRWRRRSSRRPSRETTLTPWSSNIPMTNIPDLPDGQ